LALFVKNFLKGESTSNGGTAGDDYKDPSGDNYVLKFGNPPTVVPQVGYYYKGTCDVNAQDGVAQNGASRQFALTIKLESQAIPYCLDNKS
jgi:hypothetical protein